MEFQRGCNFFEVGVQRSFVPREEFLGRPFNFYASGSNGSCNFLYGIAGKIKIIIRNSNDEVELKPTIQKGTLL